MSTHLLLGFTAGVYLTHGSVPQTLLFLDGFSAFFEFMFSYPYYYLAMYLTLGSMGSYHLLRALHSELKEENADQEATQEAEAEQEEQEAEAEQEEQEAEAEQEEQEATQEAEAGQEITQETTQEITQETTQEEQETTQETTQEATQETTQEAEDGDETEEEMHVETISEDMDIETDDDMPPLLPLSPHEEQDTDAYAPLFQVINA